MQTVELPDSAEAPTAPLCFCRNPEEPHVGELVHLRLELEFPAVAFLAFHLVAADVSEYPQNCHHVRGSSLPRGASLHLSSGDLALELPRAGLSAKRAPKIHLSELRH